jgi:two-component system chemotaxis response regulator CheY
VRALEAVQASLGDPSAGDPALIHLAGTLVMPGKIPDKDLETSLAAGQAQTVVEAKPNEAKAHEAKPEVPRGPLRVVLVEPSRAQSGIIRRYLQAQGIDQVVVVASGQEALAAIRKERPDALVSALHLADMTGVQLAQHVRAESDKAGQAAPGFVLISSEADSAESGSLSKYGKGTILKKPFTPEKLSEALRLVSDPAATPAPGPTLNPGKLRVLIVDDSAPARLHMRNVLKSLGLEQFVEAPDGAQAVAAVAQGTFDLIVTDYNMPFMDGRGLVGYLRQNPATASAPIIMVTTETDPAKLDAVRQLGVTVCDKSFPPGVVRGVLDKIASVK